jgi:diketogulonate reductase-like aldo/keto reductase
LISWGIKRGYCVIPKSVTPSRIISNFHVVELNDDDFKTINKLIEGKEQKRLGDPYYSWDVDVFGLHN